MSGRRSLAALLLLTSTARAAPTAEEKQACVEAYEGSQVARRDGYLLKARGMLQECLQPSCHEVMRQDCDSWLKEVELSLGSVIVRVEDPAGKPVDAATVRLEGTDVSLRPNSEQELELDPGHYRLVGERSGFESTTADFQLAAGSRRQIIRLVLRPLASVVATSEAAKPQDNAPRYNTSWPLYVFGGVGLAGFGALIGFGVSARNGDHALEDCAATSTCSPESTDAVKLDYTLANVGLGVGIAGVSAAAAWFFFVPAPSEAGAVQVGFTPAPGGALTTLRGSF